MGQLAGLPLPFPQVLLHPHLVTPLLPFLSPSFPLPFSFRPPRPLERPSGPFGTREAHLERLRATGTAALRPLYCSLAGDNISVLFSLERPSGPFGTREAYLERPPGYWNSRRLLERPPRPWNRAKRHLIHNPCPPCPLVDNTRLCAMVMRW